MTAAPLTADDLLHIAIPDKATELVRGKLMVREPPGAQHGFVAARMNGALLRYAETNDLGVVFAAETGFKLFADPDTVRAPDAAFVSKARVPTPMPVGYLSIAPDLVVEVVSPGDRPGEVLAKVADWLEAGSRLVWVIDPVRELARIYRADGTETLVPLHRTLRGEPVLPGFVCELRVLLGC